MCKYCEPDEEGNLANIEEDSGYLLTYLEDGGTNWWLVTEMNTRCRGTDCWSEHVTTINNCPMCGRKLPKAVSDR